VTCSQVSVLTIDFTKIWLKEATDNKVYFAAKGDRHDNP